MVAKSLKYSEIRDREDKELDAKTAAFRKSLFDLKMEKATRKEIKNSHEISILRKNIARLLTAKNAKRGQAKSRMGA